MGKYAQNQLANIRKVWELADQYQKAAEECVKIAHTNTEHLAANIKKGNSTGDSFADFVIIAYNSVSEKYVLCLRSLEKSVGEHPNELISIIACEDHARIYSVRFYLARLSGSKLIISTSDQTSCYFPIERGFVQKNDISRSFLSTGTDLGFRLGHERISLLNLNELVDPEGNIKWPSCLSEMGRRSAQPRKKLEIVVGTNAVKNWFKSHGRQNTFEEMLETLRTGV